MNILNQAAAFFPTMHADIPGIGNIEITDYAFAFVVFVVLTVSFWILRKVVLSRLAALSKRTHNDVDDMLIRVVTGVRAWAYIIVAFYIALQLLELPGILSIILTGIFLVTVVWQIVEGIVTVIDYIAVKFIEKDEDGDGAVDPNSATASSMVTLFARIVLWALGGLFVLSNLGIEVTSLIAGLGIGGIAIAFALQNILSDLFSSLSIYLDKPFRVGDFVVIGEHSGTVEKIGVKTTRLKTLQGEELVVSNSELTSTRVQNFKRMSERRVVMQFGILYETPYESVEKVPEMVRAVFGDIKKGRLDRVHFTTFGDSALIFEVVYYVDTPDYNDFLSVQEEFNFKLMQSFAGEGIEFAYPTQMIHLKK